MVTADSPHAMNLCLHFTHLLYKILTKTIIQQLIGQQVFTQFRGMFDFAVHDLLEKTREKLP